MEEQVVVIYAGVNGYLDRSPSTGCAISRGAAVAAAKSMPIFSKTFARPAISADATAAQAQGRGRRLRQDLRLSAEAGLDRWPDSRTCAFASPPPRRRRRSPRPCRWSRPPSCAARRRRRKPRDPSRSAWRSARQHRRGVGDLDSAPKLLAGTGNDQRSSPRRLHCRTRPVRPVQLGDRAPGPRARQRAEWRGQGGQVLLRRPQGLRASAPHLRKADHRACRAARRAGARFRDAAKSPSR